MLETVFANFKQGKNCKFFLGLHFCHHQTPSYFLEQILLANASHCSDSSQYAIMISRSLIRIFFLQGQTLIKSFLMIDLDLFGCVHKKRIPLVFGTYSYIFYFQASAYEKQGCARIAHLSWKFGSYRRVRSRTPPTK